MDLKTIAAFFCAVVLLGGIIVAMAVFGGGISYAAQTEAAEEAAALEAAWVEIDGDKRKLDELLGGGAGAEKPAWADVIGKLAADGKWSATVEDAHGAVSSLRDRWQKEAKPILDADDEKREEQLLTVIRACREEREKADIGRATVLVKKAVDLVDAIEKREQYVAQGEKDLETCNGLDLSDLEPVVAKAVAAWPDKKEALQRQVDRLKTVPGRAVRAHAALSEQAKKELKDLNPRALQVKAGELADLAKSVTAEKANIVALCGQLDHSWDKMLVDMEIKEGYEDSEFLHQYKVVKVDANDQHTEQSEWKKVGEAVYKAHEPYMGMTLESKPKGLFDHEAVKVVSPPLYSYIGNRHYGQWNEYQGRRRWVWHSRYGWMRRSYYYDDDYHWYHDDWDDWDSHRRSGRVYYGRSTRGTVLFGTSGSRTKSRYGQSRYVKNDGYKKSAWKSSGGKYRGSRYTASNTSSGSSSTRRTGSSGSSYGSSGSSSSSSSGYRRGSSSSSGSRSSGK